eukprot:26835-Prymnesium_polylepis.4
MGAHNKETQSKYMHKYMHKCARASAQITRVQVPHHKCNAASWIVVAKFRVVPKAGTLKLCLRPLQLSTRSRPAV